VAGLAAEMALRCTRLAAIIRSRRPGVLAGIGGAFIAPAGRLTGVPALAFTDTENASLSNRITFPLASKVITPDCYQGPAPPAKHITYPGYHELAYAHPARFTPRPEALAAFGLEPGEPFILMRLVGWQSSHDFSDSGITEPEQMVRRLAAHGKVLISSERELPPSLEPHRLCGPLDRVLHLQAFARLFIGESATMASECAVLGTPAVFVSTSTRGYTDEQGRRYGLVYTYSDPGRGQAQALERAERILGASGSRQKYRARARRLLQDKIDVTRFISEVVIRHAKPSH
jgi:hypothetical protein